MCQNLFLGSVSKKCVKCKEATAALVIRAGDAFCRGCFKEYFIHKFRAMLGKNRVIFPGEKVLLAVSGGPASCTMLAQVLEGLSRDAPKRLRFLPGIVYIDEGGVIGRSKVDRQETVVQLEAVFKTSGFPYHIVPLEQVLELPSSVLETDPSSSSSSSSAPNPDRTEAGSYKAAVDRFIQTNQNHDLSTANQTGLSGLRLQDREPAPMVIDESHSQSLQRLFGSVKTLTAKEELLQNLRQHLLVWTARSHGYTKLMLGASCTRLAVRLLSSIALGRGAALAMDTGFSDSRYGDVVIVRPMRDYSSKEIVFYGRMFNVPSVFIEGLDTKTQDKASIQRLTESFVTKLQADFPSTVSTIYRTSEKLHTVCPPTSSTSNISDKCLLCLCALDTTVEASSAFQATLISEQLSQRRAPTSSLPLPGGQCCSSGGVQGEERGCGAGGGGGGGGGGGCCSSTQSQQPMESLDLKSLLCYCCRLTLKDMRAVEDLPNYILSEAFRRKRRSQIKEEISDFLLNDDDDDDDDDDVVEVK
ncbi:cytoplasmic tRNA 2-thiolation protein 2 [Aplochiton taeniatus]